ncbi:amidohydrolase [Cytobacillus sp. IB215316]|uniref:amidohydrolase n=1 Tax=Cytobacillus sp. IB215316 TaxID=3097354 RepID=UPI002A14D78D|nr:amidohydrolase [Cytobacillus sp. IB215316]MDX8362738.1 amidohydrolase [Cytobacillus sp. IB215316]
MSSTFLKNITPTLIEWRRSLHALPELGFMEYITTYRLGKELEKMGFNLYIGKEVLLEGSRMGVPSIADLESHEKKALDWGVEESWLDKMRGGNTGLVATWDSGKKGEHIGFRFDIDALPINESTDLTHLPSKNKFVSNEENVMHACGHDGHAAIGLGVAKYISSHNDELKGRFTLLFQPAEEGGRGARAMTAKGWLDDVDYFYSGHIGIQSLPVGTIAATTQGFLASTKFNVYFKGVSSHAGMNPELGKNALLAATTAANHLYGIPRHHDGITRVNVGRMTAGSGRNIIPEDSYMEIEVRGETAQIAVYMAEKATQIIQAAAHMHDVSYTIEEVGVTEVVVCDDALIPTITDWCSSSEFIKEVLPVVSVSGSEDVSFMMNRVQEHGGKATYMLFGTELDYPHHHPRFNFQEETLLAATEAYICILNGGSRDV